MGKRKQRLALGIIEKVVSIPQAEGEDPFLLYVRGLSPADITALMSDDVTDEMRLLYRELVNVAVTPEQVEQAALAVLWKMPTLMAKTIAKAADADEEWEEVMNWAIGSQVEALQTIAVLTFTSESVAKKLREVVENFLRESPSDLLKPLKGGSGA